MLIASSAPPATAVTGAEQAEELPSLRRSLALQLLTDQMSSRSLGTPPRSG